ncbi:MAG: hypothetical protein ABEK01_03135 [Candidatus Nanohaloarchaea archaeon]
MSLFGNKNDETPEEIKQLKDRVEDLNSQVNAMDSALSDFKGRVEDLEDKNELGAALKARAQNNREMINSVEDTVVKFYSNYKDSGEARDNRLEKLEKDRDEMRKEINSVEADVQELREGQEKLSERVEEIEEKIDEVEGDFVLETNRQEMDIERKIDKGRFRSHEEEMEDELAKLRASINVLADHLDKKDEIEVD